MGGWHLIAPFVYKIKPKFLTEPQILCLKPKSVESRAWVSECNNGSFLGIKEGGRRKGDSIKKKTTFFVFLHRQLVKSDKFVIVRILRDVEV